MARVSIVPPVSAMIAAIFVAAGGAVMTVAAVALGPPTSVAGLLLRLLDHVFFRMEGVPGLGGRPAVVAGVALRAVMVLPVILVAGAVRAGAVAVLAIVIHWIDP